MVIFKLTIVPTMVLGLRPTSMGVGTRMGLYLKTLRAQPIQPWHQDQDDERVHQSGEGSGRFSANNARGTGYKAWEGFGVTHAVLG